METSVQVIAGDATLDGDLVVPEGASGIVVFAHGSGSSRQSPRNRQVAAALQEAGLATLLFDLLTADEDRVDRRTRELRFDIGLLADRLVGAVWWLAGHERTRDLAVGCFGASTGAAAALVAAARMPDRRGVAGGARPPSGVAAVVSRGGRPDLAGDALPQVRQPVLLVVGGADPQVLTLNREAAARLPGDVDLQVVEGATHLFEEPGALEEVSRLAAAFLTHHLSSG